MSFRYVGKPGSLRHYEDALRLSEAGVSLEKEEVEMCSLAYSQAQDYSHEDIQQIGQKLSRVRQQQQQVIDDAFNMLLAERAKPLPPPQPSPEEIFEQVYAPRSPRKGRTL